MDNAKVMNAAKKKVLVALRMAGVAGRDKLAGIFRFLSTDLHNPPTTAQSEICNLKSEILPTTAQSKICNLKSEILPPATQSEICNLKSEILLPDWDMTLVRTAADFTPARMRAALAARYDGFIVSIPNTERTASLLADSTVPTVVMDIHDPALSARTRNIVFIRNSPEEIGRTAADFLLSTGRCRSYAFIQNPSVAEWSVDRFKAFREMLRDRGLWCHALGSPRELATLERPIGVLAANDDTGYDTLEWCRAHRIRVPGDALVIGINNDTLICENCHPRLTSIQPDFEAEGYLAAQTLAEMMNSTSETRLASSRICQTSSEICQSDAPIQQRTKPLCQTSSEICQSDAPIQQRTKPPCQTSSEICQSDAPIQQRTKPLCQTSSEICHLKSEISHSDLPGTTPIPHARHVPTLFVGVKTIVRRDSTADVSSAGKLVQKAVAFMRAHALEGISVTDVVRHLGCSRRLADLRFRELQDASIGETILSLRLEEVRTRLETTTEPIASISRACGYENENYLKNLFKKRFGMTMRDYRAKNRVT